MLYILILALASSGLAQAQLPSTQWSQVRGGFVRELQISGVDQNIRWFASVGQHFVLLSDDSEKRTTLTVWSGNKVAFSIKDGNPRLRGTLFGNRQVFFNGDWAGNKIVFGSWCGARTTPTGTIKDLCQLLELDVPTKTLREIAYVSQTISATFNGRKTLDWSITGLSMAAIGPTGTFLGMNVAKGQLITNGLFRIETIGITQLTSFTESPGHKQVSVDGATVATSPDGKKVFYEETLAPNGSNLRVYDLDKKTYEILLGPGQSVEGYPLSFYYTPLQDYFNRRVYVRSAVLSTVAEVYPQLRILYRPNQNIDGVQLTTSGLYTSNGLTGFTAKVGSTNEYTQYVINGKILMDGNDVVSGRKIERFDATAPTVACKSLATSVDKGFFNQMLIDVRPVFISSLSAGPQGQLAQLGGCGLNLEGTTLDSVTIGGATAEVVSRETDANGQDVLVVRPLSPVYAGQTEVAVTVNGKRFTNTLVAEGPKAPEIKILHYATELETYDLAANTLAKLVGPTGRSDTAPFLGDPMGTLERGGATVSVCGTPTYIFRNFGNSLLFLIPRELAGGDKTECEVVLRVDDKDIGRKTIHLVDDSPGIFKIPTRRLPSGELDPQSGVASFFDAVGNLISTPVELIPNARPTYPGETIALYGTGFGPVFADGNRNICTDVSGALRLPTVKVGGTTAIVTYCGEVPGTRGLYQINFEVPPGTEVDAEGNVKMVPVWPWSDWRPDLEYFIPVVPQAAAPAAENAEPLSAKNIDRLSAAPTSVLDELGLAVWRIVLEDIVRSR